MEKKTLPQNVLCIIDAFRQNKNMNNYLVRSKVKHWEGQDTGHKNKKPEQRNWIHNTQSWVVFKIPTQNTE